MSTQQNRAKRAASLRAIEEFVRDGMKLGIGSGSTAHFFVQALGGFVAGGMKLSCAATSRSTIDAARQAGITIADPNDLGELDLVIDGADEIDRQFSMIKGGGGCLLWEKIIAHASKQMIVICDESKIVDQLGAFPLPIEIVPFAWRQTERMVARVLSGHGLQATIARRLRQEQALITDGGHFILDCTCGPIADPAALEIDLNRIPGVVENGLFTREAAGMAVGRLDGSAYVQMRATPCP